MEPFSSCFNSPERSAKSGNESLMTNGLQRKTSSNDAEVKADSFSAISFALFSIYPEK